MNTLVSALLDNTGEIVLIIRIHSQYRASPDQRQDNRIKGGGIRCCNRHSLMLS